MSPDPISAADQRIEQLESSFPAAAGVVFSQAYDLAIQAGLSVVVSEDGAIYEVFPDGQRRLIKTITPPTPAEPGRKLTLR